MRRSLKGKLGFYEIERGMTQYIETFAAELGRTDVRLGVGARELIPAGGAGGYYLQDDKGGSAHFEQVVLATSSRDAAALLNEVAPLAQPISTVDLPPAAGEEVALYGSAGDAAVRSELHKN